MNNSNNLYDLRRSYLLKELSEESVLKNPLDQFKIWMDEAINSNIIEPNAMTIATAQRDGTPSARIVLLRKYDERGFIFFSNYLSAKANDLNENPKASILFYWAELERQVRIAGSVEKISSKESEEYFATRPRGHQISAWASEQSKVISDRKELERQFLEIEKKFEGKEIPLPPFWGGYRLVPIIYEFWQGRESRLHDRIRYSLVDGNWKIERLSP